MKVKELIEELKKMPQDMEVYVPSATTENDYCNAYSVCEMTLYNNDGEEGGEDEFIEAVVIDEQ